MRFTGLGSSKPLEKAAHRAERIDRQDLPAICVQRLGEIALSRSDHDAALTRYEEALPMFRKIGAVLGEANCIRSLGDIALARSDHDTAREQYNTALALYQRIPEPYSIGVTHVMIAHIAPDDEERDEHLQAARDAWRSIGRTDLIEGLDEAFGGD